MVRDELPGWGPRWGEESPKPRRGAPFPLIAAGGPALPCRDSPRRPSESPARRRGQAGRGAALPRINIAPAFPPPPPLAPRRLGLSSVELPAQQEQRAGTSQLPAAIAGTSSSGLFGLSRRGQVQAGCSAPWGEGRLGRGQG